MILAAIDPGRRCSGWAIFSGARLIKTGGVTDVTLPEAFAMFLDLFDRYSPDDGIIEIPQVYQQKFWKGDPNDLIEVALYAGVAIAALSRHARFKMVRPHDWKGTVPKDIDNKHTLSKLTAEETAVFKGSGVKKKLEHNLIDAIGLGLWKLGRK